MYGHQAEKCRKIMNVVRNIPVRNHPEYFIKNTLILLMSKNNYAKQNNW